MYRIYIPLLSLFASTPVVADQSGLGRLLEGNKRYVQDALEHPNRTSERRESVVSRQEPFAVIVGCADSRVSPEIIFDQGVGDLFVVRVAGNVVGPLELESILYSVIYLHSSVILVLGHENCGAVDAVIQGNTKDIRAVAEIIQPSVESAKLEKPANLLEASVKANAIQVRDYLLTNPVIQKLIEDKKVQLHAGYYHLQTGEVEVLK